LAPRFFSIRAPLNFLAALVIFAGFLTAMNSPDFLLAWSHAVAPLGLVFT
jgi:hypothetical protein